MRLCPCTLPLVLVMLCPMGASAFRVSSHEVLTRAALDAVRTERGDSTLERHRAGVLAGAREEDLNLNVKWTGWSHFYHPGMSLDSAFRRDSSARVRALWEEAEEAASNGRLDRAFDRVGHLLHHIQDMACPPHVVPVMHGLDDRFEQQPLSEGAMARAAERRLMPMSGSEAQEALARETLKAVETESLAVTGGAIPWTAFWAYANPPIPGVFGTYGEAGNSFGLARVRWRGSWWTVEPAGYQEFLDARTSAAVAYSRAFLLWAAQRLATLDEARAPEAMAGEWTPAAQAALEVVGGSITTARGARPVVGARAILPLPWSFALSMSYGQTLRAPLLSGDEEDGAWSLTFLSPPLLTYRLSYSLGISLHASAGGGLSYRDDDLSLELPIGLRLQAQLGTHFLLSVEGQYRVFAPSTGPWGGGVVCTGGVGFIWNDQ